MIRLASPVRHFMRTATADTEIAGTPIKKGDWLMLHYTAANLDPRHFADPLRFDVTRANANKQIAFGFGIHFCLGAQLARQELRSLFTHLVPRLGECWSSPVAKRPARRLRQRLQVAARCATPSRDHET